MKKIIVIITIFCFTSCASNKVYIGKPYKLGSYAGVRFFNNDSCILSGETGKFPMKWKKNQDTISLISYYSKDSIPINHYNYVSDSSEYIKTQLFTNGKPSHSPLIIVRYLNLNKVEVGSYANNSLPEERTLFKGVYYFNVSLNAAKTALLPLHISGGGTLQIYLDYTDEPHYPFGMNEKYLFRKQHIKTLNGDMIL